MQVGRGKLEGFCVREGKWEWFSVMMQCKQGGELGGVLCAGVGGVLCEGGEVGGVLREGGEVGGVLREGGESGRCFV